MFDGEIRNAPASVQSTVGTDAAGRAGLDAAPTRSAEARQNGRLDGKKVLQRLIFQVGVYLSQQ
jgi:hypothetical protein